jgi:hypothetical protein
MAVLLKGNSMKKHLLRLSIIAALAAGAGFAETYTFDVPFDFVAWNKTMPGGEYHMDKALTSPSGVVTMRSADRKTTFVVLGSSGLEHRQQTGTLVFHRYGNRYFLAEVWTRGTTNGLKLPVSHQERELQAQGKIRSTEMTVAVR